jgi:predicted TIM-barrel fold metal-dependent hydrolase
MPDYRFISVDDHIDIQYLPKDLWTSRLPKKYTDSTPHVEVAESGLARWVCEDKVWGSWAGVSGKVPPRSFQNALERGGVYEQGVLRPTIAELRLADMDRDNIEATFMFGPLAAFRCSDPELRRLIYTAYNDWLIEFCSFDPGRLHGIAVLPGEDVQGATDELYRLAKTGRTQQVNFLIGSADPPIYDNAWEPFWSAAEETGLIVSFHVGGGGPAPGGPPAANAPEKPSSVFRPSKGFILQFLDPFHGLLAEGTLDRHPGVRVMLAEVGLGWIPWLIHEMDYRYERLMANKEYWEPRGGVHLTMSPSEIWRRNFWITFQDDPVGLALLEFCNEDHILWASDYPHPDSTFPDSVRIVGEQMAKLTPLQQQKILRQNALALYGLETRAPTMSL